MPLVITSVLSTRVSLDWGMSVSVRREPWMGCGVVNVVLGGTFPGLSEKYNCHLVQSLFRFIPF